MPAWLLAHQGGWDEILMVLGPLVAIAALLWLAKSRADRLPPATGDDQPLNPSGSPKRPAR